MGKEMGKKPFSLKCSADSPQPLQSVEDPIGSGQVRDEPRRAKNGSFIRECAVEGCTSTELFSVWLNDTYRDSNNEIYDTFHEQDFTCPFLCKDHMEENKALSVWPHETSTRAKAPYSNRYHARGWTTYKRTRKTRK